MIRRWLIYLKYRHDWNKYHSIIDHSLNHIYDFFRMNNPQLKNFACFKQCILMLMTISVGASYVVPASITVPTIPKISSTVPSVSTYYENLQKCPSGLDLYSPHNLKQSAIKLIVTGLNTWPSKGLLITYGLVILNQIYDLGISSICWCWVSNIKYVLLFSGGHSEKQSKQIFEIRGLKSPNWWHAEVIRWRNNMPFLILSKFIFQTNKTVNGMF